MCVRVHAYVRVPVGLGSRPVRAACPYGRRVEEMAPWPLADYSFATSVSSVTSGGHANLTGV